MTTGIPVTRETLNSKIFDWGISAASAFVVVTHQQFECPAQDWVEREFSEGWRVASPQTVGKYEGDAIVCEDFSEECAAYAHICFRRTAGRAKNCALAFGVFWFRRWDGVHHAINCFLVRDDTGEPQLKFYEPQTAEIVTLSNQEIQACTLIRI